LPYSQYDEYFGDTATSDERLSLERINQLTHKIIELEELEKTLIKWADIFKQAHWGIAMHVGKSNTFELTNAAFNELYGYTTQEMRKLSVPDLFTPESLLILPVIQKEAFEKGYVAFESLHKRKDGSTFPVSVELIVIKNEEGEILYHIANIWDLTQKKAAEDRLMLKKFALDHIKDAVFMIDEYARFHYVNEGACNALGYEREEFESMDVGDVDPDWPRERWLEHWNALKEAGSMTMELRHKRKDGTLFPVEVSVNFIEYNGKYYNMAIARDITERLQLEEQKENRRIRSITENSPDIIVRFDLEGRRTYANPKAAQLFTVDMLGKTLSDVTPVINKEFFAENLNNVIRTQQEISFETAYIDASGKNGWADMRMVPEFGSDGTISSVLSIGRDITERKHAEEALALKEREFRSLAENTPDNIARWDANGGYLYINPVHERTLGISLAEAIGSYIPESHTEVKAAIAQVAATGQTIIVHQLVPDENGEIEIHDVTLVPERDDDGKIISILGIGRDMTDIYRLQDEIAGRERELRALADSSPGMMGSYYLRPDGSICMPYASPNFLDIFGLNPEDVREDATPLLALNHPDDAARVRETIAESAQTMSVWHQEYRIIHPLKGVRWMESNTKPELHPHGGIIWYGYVHDITERKETEALLEKEHKFLTDAQRVAYTGSWYVDIQSNILAWSDETYRIFELDKEQVEDLHKTFYECVHPDDREMVNAPYMQTLKTKLPYEIEHRIVMADGRIKYVIERCEHAYSQDGTPLYSVGTVQDITERKIAEDALQSNKILLQSILESSPGVITFALDKNYRYIAFDSKHALVMNTIFGIEITIGMNMLEAVISDADKEIAKRSFDRALSGESFIAEEEYGDERLSRRYWRIFYSPVRSETKEIIGLTCFNVDITER
jgi:PAS domain S-box-containing protein